MTTLKRGTRADEEPLSGVMPASPAIIDAITPYSITLFASKNLDGAQPYFAGSGTLVTVGGRTAILTARHVWTEMLAKATTFGFPYRDGYGEMRLLKKTVFKEHLPSLRSKPYDPDFCFVEIPRELALRIEAFSRIRYNLQKARPVRPSRQGILAATEYTVCGSPAVMGQISTKSVDYKHYCYTMPEGKRAGEGYRYLEFPLVYSGKDVPPTFGGVSGGGLWRVVANQNAETPDYYLAGVVYEESDVVNGIRSLRIVGIDIIAEESKALFNEEIWTPQCSSRSNELF